MGLPTRGSEYKFYLDEMDYGNEEHLMLFRDDEDGKRYRAKIEWVEHSAMDYIDRENTTFMLPASRRGHRRPVSSLLIAALQECGELRKAQVTDTADLRGWLDDMRKLVFKEHNP
jgi:hypothetical protein